MRIITGQFRGRKLKFPKSQLRPTADRVKEALFNILGAEVVGARVLDLFAGSGNLGLEALSRGAASVHFVEIASGTVRTLEQNIGILECEGRSEVYRMDVVKFIQGARSPRYDIAFADPPYEGEGAGEVRDLFLATPFARILCIEHRAGGLEGADDERRYGDNQLSFFRRP